jgi:hypothetical protein
MTEEAHGALHMGFNYQCTSTEQVEEVLASEAKWREHIESYNCQLDEEAERDSRHQFLDQFRETRNLTEMRELYQQGNAAWARMRELAPSALPLLNELRQRLNLDQKRESGRCSVKSAAFQRLRLSCLKRTKSMQLDNA